MHPYVLNMFDRYDIVLARFFDLGLMSRCLDVSTVTGCCDSPKGGLNKGGLNWVRHSRTSSGELFYSFCTLQI